MIRDHTRDFPKAATSAQPERDAAREDRRCGLAESLPQATLDALSAHIAVLDEDGGIIAVNRAWHAFAEANPPLTSNVNEGASYLAVCDAATGADADEAAAVAAGIRAVIRGDENTVEMEYPCHSPNTKRWFVCRVSRFPGTGISRVVVAHENITARKLVEEKLRESEKRFRTLSEHSPIGISLVRPDMTYAYVNPFFTQMFGYSVADVGDRQTWYEKAYPDPVYRERVRKAWLADFAERDGFWRMQQETLTVRCKDGTDKIIRVNGAVLPDNQVLMTHEDVTQLAAAQNALEHLAMHDPLTGLFNRRAILERLAQEISRAKREDGRVSVGMLDIDHFKSVNDTHGHQVGDEVLIAFSKRIQSPLRDYDCLGRYGGEEFLVITAAPRTQIEGNLYERLRATVADAPIPTKAGPMAVTVSIGVARGTGASTVDELIAAADIALYQAKADGRNRVVDQ